MTKFKKAKNMDTNSVIEASQKVFLEMLDESSKYSFSNNLQNQNFSLIPLNKRINIDFKGLTLSIKEGNIFQKRGTKTILDNISGSMKSGQLTGIMGPSGSGKTTLMSLLAGSKAKPTAGEIYINGQHRDLRTFRKMSCYIMQDDHLLPQLTVWEAMMISANLKLKETLPKKVKEQVVTDILWLMGLFFSKDTKSDKLSGGQRKRLSIALELVNNPPVMFFDEATSGLDSVSSYQCLKILKTLAQAGRNIICTIHQPSARLFEIFDNVYILVQGQCIYQGPQSRMLPFLSHHDLNCPPFHNPADFVMEVACGEYGNVVSKLIAHQRGRHGNLGGRTLSESRDDGTPGGTVAEGVVGNKMRYIDGVCTGEELPPLADPETFALMEEVSYGRVDRENAEYRPDDKMSNSVVLRMRETDLADPLTESSAPDILITRHVTKPTLNSSDGHVPGLVCPIESEFGLNGGEGGVPPCADGVLKSQILLDKISENQCYNCTTSFLTQFRVLFVRAFVTILRDGTLTRLRLACHLIVGLLIGLLYYNIGNEAGKIWNNSGCLFFSMLFIMFAALMPTVLTFPTEMMVFIKEHLNYWYSLKCYYFAKTLADLPFQIVFPLIYGTIVYWMTAQPPDFTRFVMFLTLSTMTALVSQSLGLIIGAGMSLQVAVFLGPVTAIPILLFSGFFINFDTIPPYLQWLSYLSYVRYSFEGVLLTVYGFGREPLKCQQKFCFFKKATDYLELMDVDKGKWHVDFLALCLFFVVMRGAVYFVLKWRIYKSKW